METLNIFFYITLIILNFLLIKLITFLSKNYQLYDFPNSRKLHTKPISYLGGFLFFLSNLTYLLYYKTLLFESHFLIYNLSHVFSLIFVSSFIFLTGLLDDKVDLSPLKKTIILIILISSSVMIDGNLLITKLNFEIIEKDLFLKNFSFFFTILCIYIFINASNMFDGADLQLGLYFFVIIIYLFFKSNYFNIFAPIIIPLIIFLFANFKKVCFMGNNGSHFLSYILSIFIIKFYNLGILKTVEEVVIIMLIPGLDLIRLFIKRVLNNKNFFESDLDHIHHRLSRNKQKHFVQLIILIFNISPIVIAEMTGSYLIGIISGIIAYFLLLRKI